MTADKCHPPTEKIYEATKGDLPRLHSASSAKGIGAKRARSAVRRESVDAKRLSS